MWYVNSILVITDKKVKVSFILTMWYVNDNDYFDIKEVVYVLY